MSAAGAVLDAAIRRAKERRAESEIRRCRSCGRQLFGRGNVCRSRRCPEYGPVWAGDQRQKLFRNLETLPGDILLSAVTAPGAGALPWDTQQCDALGEHRHSGKLGCRVSRVAAREWNESAADRWRRLHRRAYQDTTKEVGRGSVFFTAPAKAGLLAMPRPVDSDATVFRGKKGGVLTGRTQHYYWHPVRCRFGKPSMDFYELRHFCGSWLFNDLELPAQDVAHQLGHTDGGALVQRLYGHPSERLARERIKRATAGKPSAAVSHLDAEQKRS